MAGKGSDRRWMNPKFCTYEKFSYTWDNIFCKKDESKIDFEYGEKVIYLPENKIYDFGYIGSTGKAIIYNEGEHNMQDSYAVDMDKIKKVGAQDE